jgi:hypothetical protein
MATRSRVQRWAAAFVGGALMAGLAVGMAGPASASATRARPSDLPPLTLPPLPELTVPTTLPEVTVPPTLLPDLGVPTTLPELTVPTTLPALPGLPSVPTTLPGGTPTVPGSPGLPSVPTTLPGGVPGLPGPGGGTPPPPLPAAGIPVDLDRLIALLDGLVADVTDLVGKACRGGHDTIDAATGLDALVRLAGETASPVVGKADYASGLLARTVADVADVIGLGAVAGKLRTIPATAGLDLRSLALLVRAAVPDPSGAGVKLCPDASTATTGARVAERDPAPKSGGGSRGIAGLPFTGAEAGALALLGAGLVTAGWILKRKRPAAR